MTRLALILVRLIVAVAILAEAADAIDTPPRRKRDAVCGVAFVGVAGDWFWRWIFVWDCMKREYLHWLIEQETKGVSIANRIADNTYRRLSEPFLADAFSTALRAWLVTFNNETWQSESWDCDDYAMEATMLMRRLHKATPGSKGTAPAFGFIWYESAQRGLHAINFAIVGKRKVVYYEPQLQRIVTLTDAEKRSIEFVYV